MAKKNVKRVEHIYRLGENYFEGLCIGCDMVASPPKQDKNGWDFFVELPQNRLLNFRMDGQPPPLKVLCQVKATDNFESMSLQMKLSNFEHLARTPLPSFVFVIDFAGRDTPNKAYLCHFGKERIIQTFKRVRELDANNDRELHKHTMGLLVKPDEELDLSDNLGLIKAIRKHAGVDLSAYSNVKSELLLVVGYEDKSRFSLKFESGVEVRDFVDTMLGIGDISIDRADIYSNRFGIEILDHSLSSGRLSVEPTSAGTCKLTAVSKKNKRVEIDGDIFAPSIPGLPFQFWKLLVKTKILEATLEPSAGIGRFNIKLNPNLPIEIEELRACLEFIAICNESKASIEFRKDGKVFAAANFDEKDGFGDSFKELIRRTRIVRKFAEFIGYRGSLLIQPNDLFDQDEALQWIEFALNKNSKSATATIDLKEDLPKQTGIFGAPIAIRLNKCCLIALCWWNASYTVEGDAIKATMLKCNVWDGRLLDFNDAPHYSALFEDYKDFCNKLNKGILLISKVPIDLAALSRPTSAADR